ncbi:MAG TPA: cysteine dioxygenase family protein [Candidatus Binatia bacterium]|nr:cysteine dioxygenase family protein [Candidatus Binatia bacterium]
MIAELSLAELVKDLLANSSVGPEFMQDALERLAIPLADIQPHTRFSDYRYARNLVHKTDRFEIMVMCWHAGQRSSIHDHAGSLGGLKILQGRLTESLFEKAPNGMIKSAGSLDYNAGEIRVEETSLIHQISNLQAENGKAISIHIYAPPLVRMNVYSLEDPSVKNVLPQYFSFGSGI